jgi:hypothetical protein
MRVAPQPNEGSRNPVLSAEVGRGSCYLIRAFVVTSRTEQYRRLASECRRVAKTLSPGDRKALLEMAEQWDRLADQQERATDLRKGR